MRHDPEKRILRESTEWNNRIVFVYLSSTIMDTKQGRIGHLGIDGILVGKRK